MNRLNVLVAGSTGYIGVQLVNFYANIDILKLNIFVGTHRLEKKYIFTIKN